VKTNGTILIAEDNISDVALFRWALQKIGLTNPLQVVPDGHQAILYLKGEGAFSDRTQFPFPKLVFLDIEMPSKNGLEVLTWIRQQPGLQRLPVIVLTTSSFDSIIRTAYALGASSFVTKPPNYINFTAEIKQLTDAWLEDEPPSQPMASPSSAAFLENCERKEAA
jgi:CheY-like chemotaxis protein